MNYNINKVEEQLEFKGLKHNTNYIFTGWF
jgi:hypothetical protein